MKFTEEKKKAILFYILEKIESGCESLTKTVSEALGINQNTVHTYINELEEKNIIKRIMRGKYELVQNSEHYDFYRSRGEIDSDSYAYNKCFEKYIEDFEGNVKLIWNYAFSEMMNNVMDHSAAQKVTVYVFQNYLNTSVIIDDNGIGIFKKIKDHFGFESLDEAICELFKGKLTTDSANHSGEGIFFSSRMMDKFFIYSDDKIFTRDRFETENIIALKKSSPGTLVYMSLSNFSEKKAEEIFNTYSDPDGGFYKTTVPLKNAFDSSPVSRSQAKRICNRLEKFKEVELDFEGIEWMGQGFAHQLFVVFQNANPNTKLTSVNMTDSVRKMYNHVINTK